jgi:hypothetical protein
LSAVIADDVTPQKSSRHTNRLDSPTHS